MKGIIQKIKERRQVWKEYNELKNQVYTGTYSEYVERERIIGHAYNMLEKRMIELKIPENRIDQSREELKKALISTRK